MATETFTLTLDNTPTESVSVTINDTSLTPSGEQSYTTPGTYTFTVPTGVTSLDIFVVGGGGGGSVGQYSNGSPGGSGGGGIVQVSGFTVTPGDTFNVSVGAGGTRGSCSTNSPFEIVTTNYNSGSSKFPQSGTITNASAGSASFVEYNGYRVTANGGQPGSIVAGGNGGTTNINANLTSYYTSAIEITGTQGNTGTSGNSGRFPGGGGGAGQAGNGGNGRGEFYRSTGGYNYYKAGSGGNGGGAYLYGSYTATADGNNAPALVTSTSPLQFNYNGGTAGSHTGTATGGSYGAGGGAGAGGQIRAQTIISGGTNYYYFWYLAGVGQAGGDGAVRFSWGA